MATDIKTTPLEPYLRDSCRLLLNCKTPSQIFTPSSSYQTPMLRNDRENVLLVYQGAFNPPHQGHASLLETGFKSAEAADLNVVAAVVLPWDRLTDDPKVRKQLLLSNAERRALWTEHEPAISAYRWVFPDDHRFWAEFFEFARWLAEEDGYEIGVRMLLGPDHLESTQHRAYKHGSAGLNMLVCDVAMRDAWILGEHGVPEMRVPGFGAWTRRAIDETELWKKAQSKACAAVDHLVHHKLDRRHLVVHLQKHYLCQLKERAGRLWECTFPGGGHLCFVARPAGSHKLETKSSSMIRKIIEPGVRDGSLEKLQDVAISPMLLMRYLDERNWWVPPPPIEW